MKTLALAIALAAGTMLSAVPATAAEPLTPATFKNMSNVFMAADLDRNGSLSSHEYVMLRSGTIEQSWLPTYRSDNFDQMAPTIVRNFALLDIDNDGALSQVEFMNLTKASMRQRVMAGDPYRWDWTPEYLSLTYYLTANPIDADHFNGKQVTNLKGETLGEVRDIVRHEETGRYYALVMVADRLLDQTPTKFRSKVIGVPLDDVLLAREDAALVLTRRGEEYILTEDVGPRVERGELRQVDTLYRI